MPRFAIHACFAFALSTLTTFAGYAQHVQSVRRSLPIAFEANQGQISADYSYRFHRDGADTMFARNGMDVVIGGKSQQPLHIEFVGGNAAPIGAQALAGHTNYFLGSDSSKWVRNVALFSEVQYSELYHGISLNFYGNDRELEHDFRVAPGADPENIVLRISGTPMLAVQTNGDLAMKSAGGSTIFRKPVAYQFWGRDKKNVDAEFHLGKDGNVYFKLGAYDHSQTLVIDPVIVFSTYLGGTGSDNIAAITTDTAGDILLTGYTTSADFPTKSPLQPNTGGRVAFVTKLDPTGKSLIYSTYLGAASSDDDNFGGAIAVDATGNAIIAGISSASDFPHVGAIPTQSCQINNGCYFITSIKPDGSALNYSGLIGGSEGAYTNGVNGRLAVDASGNAYLAGVTDDPNFDVTSGTLTSTALGYPYDQLFVLKVDATGKLIYSTIVPGNATNDPSKSFLNLFLPTGVAVDNSGRVTVVGQGGLGLPTTPGVVAGQFPNAYINVSDPTAGFILQLNQTASAISFASYLPGTDSAGGLAVDASGNLWVAGGTGETNLPVSAKAYQQTPSAGSLSVSGVQSGYIMKLAPGATSVVAATYLDGTGVGQTYETSSYSAIVLDSKSNVFVGGVTSSVDFPMKDPFVTLYEFTGSIEDMILAEMSPDLSTVEFGSFLNSTDPSFGGSLFSGIAVDAQDHLIAAGVTNSLNFPTTPDSFEPQLPNPISTQSAPPHGFVTKIDFSVAAPAVCFDTLNVEFGSVNANTTSSQTVHVTNCGNAPLTIDSIKSTDPTVVATQSCATVAAGDTCAIKLTFTPTGNIATFGSITLSDTATTIPQTVSFRGQGVAPQISSDPSLIAFGHYLVGTQSPALSFFLFNRGAAALSIASVTVSGTDFALANQNCTQQSLPQNFPCTVSLSFSPSKAGVIQGAVTVASNDPQTPQLTISLVGNGDSTYAVPSLTSIDQPTILVNTMVTETLTGANFYPKSVVQLNGNPLTTTFVSGTSLQAVIPAGAITSIGEHHSRW